MPASMTLPISQSAYDQNRRDLKNRSQRRAKVVRADMAPMNWVAHAASKTPIARKALPELPALPSASKKESVANSDAVALANSSLTQAVLLDWLGQQPIAFHRIYVDITGSVTAAVWLSFALSRIANLAEGSVAVDASGIYQFTLARTHCQAETGLIDSEQRKAHQQLVKAGVMTVNYPKKEETHPNATPSPEFKLDLRRLTTLLLARSEGLAEMVRQTVTAPTQLDVQILEMRAQSRATRRRA